MGDITWNFETMVMKFIREGVKYMLEGETKAQATYSPTGKGVSGIIPLPINKMGERIARQLREEMKDILRNHSQMNIRIMD